MVILYTVNDESHVFLPVIFFFSRLVRYIVQLRLLRSYRRSRIRRSCKKTVVHESKVNVPGQQSNKVIGGDLTTMALQQPAELLSGICRAMIVLFWQSADSIYLSTLNHALSSSLWRSVQKIIGPASPDMFLLIITLPLPLFGSSHLIIYPILPPSGHLTVTNLNLKERHSEVFGDTLVCIMQAVNHDL